MTACVPEAVAFQECPPCVEVECPPCAEAVAFQECPPCPEVEPCPSCPECPEVEVTEEYNPVPLAVWPEDKDEIAQLQEQGLDVFFICYIRQGGAEFIMLYQIEKIQPQHYSIAEKCMFFPNETPFPLEFWKENGRDVIGYPHVKDYMIDLVVPLPLP